MERVNPTSLKTSPDGQELVRYFEDCILTAHLCPADIPSVGYGHTATVTQADVDAKKRISQKEADRLLALDLVEVERLIHRHAKVNLAQCEFDALASILYNVGPGRIAGSMGPDDKGRDGIIVLKSGRPSSLLDALNRGDYSTTREWFTAWRSRGTAYERGLLRRRIAEALMFEGLPWRRGAADDFVKATTTLAEARARALEELADIEALKPKGPPNVRDIMEAPWPAPVAPAKPAPTVTIVIDKPPEPARVPAPVAGADKPAVQAPPTPAPQAPPPSVPVPPVVVAPKPIPKPPAPPLPQMTKVENLGWSGLKDMFRAKRFWGGAIFVFGNGIVSLNVLGQAHPAVRTLLGDGILMDWTAGVVAVLVGKGIEVWGERTASAPMGTAKEVALATIPEPRQ